MFKWIDRYTFEREEYLGIYNYNNVASLTINHFNENNELKYKIIAKMSNGDIIIGDVFSDKKKTVEAYKKFLKNRPGDKKIKIV